MGLRFEDIKGEFQERFRRDRRAAALLSSIEEGTATYATVTQYAERVGEALGYVLRFHAPIEDISEWDIDDLIPRSLGLDHRIVVNACRQVQEAMNRDAGIGIRYQEPTFDWDRVHGIVDELRDNPEFINIEETFYDQLTNFSQNVVDSSVRANASVASGAGIKTYVIRTASANACQWCQDAAGQYDYESVKNTGDPVWLRHKNCNCTIDYVTERNGSMYRERVYDSSNNESIAELTPEDNLTFHTYDDPIREVLGSAYESHPSELAAMKKKLQELGVELVESDRNAMGYLSNPVRGNPGQIIIDTEASYSAWLHEYQHMLDDQASGWQGARIVWIKEQAIQWEERAYDVEIEFARSRGYNEIVERLQRLKAEAISRILNG